MKKLLLIFSAGLISAGALAQSVHKAPATTQHAAKATTGANAEFSAVKTTTEHAATASKTTGLHSRWYNHAVCAAFVNSSGGAATTSAENVDSSYWTSYAGLYTMWPDSTIRYPAPSQAFGVQYLSMAQTFQPTAASFNDPAIYPAAVAAGNVLTSEPYTIDSVSVLGAYTKVDPTLVDTLIFTFTYEKSDTGGYFQYAYFSYGGSVYADHNIDSFAAVLWSVNDYMVNPINQVRYRHGLDSNIGYMQIKMPLTDDVVADTITSGLFTGLKYFSVAPGISMLDSGISAVSVTYKPSSLGTYAVGTSYDQYNHFSFISHEPDTGTGGGGFDVYNPNDLNMSSIVPKDSTNSNVNTIFNFYVPSIAFTAPYTPEEHDVMFKVSWQSAAIGNTPKNVASVTAYPNPAVTVLNIPVTMSQASNVSITLSNAAGQVVMTKNLGTVSGGATKTATFGISSLASGVYFYTVNAGGQQITNRVTIAH